MTAGLGPTVVARRVPMVTTDQLLVALEHHDSLVYADEGRALEQTARADVRGFRDSKYAWHGERVGNPAAGADKCLGAIAAATGWLGDGIGDFDIVVEGAEANMPE